MQIFANTIEAPDASDLPATPAAEAGVRQRTGRMERLLRCVSSGYLNDGASCNCVIPSGAVRAAWARELSRVRGERFFHFAWRDGTWLAYGLANGEIRGVYCPTHCAEREERTLLRYAQHRRCEHALVTVA